MELRVALLGCGGVGARHAAAVKQRQGEMRLVACCGRELARTESFAAPFGARAFADFEAMLGEARPDLLIVALPPFAHRGEVEAACRAGVHVLVEKPIALDLEQAAGMVEAAAAARVVAACGFMYRFGAAVGRWDELARAGETGRAGHFSGSLHSNALHARWWRERQKSGGQLVEQLIHIVDLARCAMGIPDTVYARAANLFHRDVPSYDSEDVSAVILGYADGRIAVLHASNAAVPGRWAKGWQIVAADMTGIFADWNRAELVRTRGAPVVERIEQEHDVFVAQLGDVAAAIREHRAPRVPLDDGLRSLEIVLAARRSADERREIGL
ncbi:MAG: Gfo/Idh/MocA family oxidoreductase [Rhizobiaceae bacterium]|nr:Gfo/Idh/MocA family oxidoreductase [Rhizobiaceae bacterium]